MFQARPLLPDCEFVSKTKEKVDNPVPVVTINDLHLGDL